MTAVDEILTTASGVRYRPIADCEAQRVASAIRDELGFYLDQKPEDFFRKRWRNPETGELVKVQDATEVASILAAMGAGAAEAAHAGQLEDADPNVEAVLAVFERVPDDFDGEIKVGEVVAMPPSEFAWWAKYGWVRRAREDEIPAQPAPESHDATARLRRRLCMLSFSKTGPGGGPAA